MNAAAALRHAATLADFVALDSVYTPAVIGIRRAVDGMRRRGLAVGRVAYVGRVYAGPSGDEAVVVATIYADPTEERRLARELGDSLISAGFYVGGVPCATREVWIRGPRVIATAAA
jgi:hypothetical protein